MVEKPPILFITYYYPPDQASGAIRPGRLVKYLERLGHSVQVLSATNELKPVIQGNVHRLRAAEASKPGFDPIYRFDREILRRSLFVQDAGATWVPRAVSYAKRWMRVNPKPVVISSAPPITIHLAGLWLKKRFGVRWLADCRDPIVGNPFRLDPRHRFFDPIFERAIFSAADVVIANTDTVLESWKRRYPKWQTKCHVLWNGFDPEEVVVPLPLPDTGCRVIAHIGALYGERNPIPFLESLRRLRQAEPSARNVRTLFVGSADGRIRRGMEPFVQEGLAEVRAEMPRPEAQRLMGSAHYLLLLDVTGQQAGLQVPAKLFEYVRIGRPIIACTTADSAVDRILRRSGVPYLGLYPQRSSEENDRRLLEFLKSEWPPAELSKWFVETFEGSRQAAFLSSLIDSLWERSRA